MRTSIVVLLALGAWGCSEIPATNPFDPTAPVAQQSKGLVRGTVVFPATVLDSSGIPADSVVDLVPFGSSAAAVSVPLAPSDDADAEEAGDAGADRRLRSSFVFEEVNAGSYSVQVRAVGFKHQFIPLELAIGERGVVEIVLEEDVDSAGEVRGVAQLEDKGDDGHAGIKVRVQNRSAFKETNPQGSYALRLPAGPVTLGFSFPGYQEKTADVVVKEGEVLEPPRVVLEFKPATVTGAVHRVGLDEGSHPATGATVTLQRRDSEEPPVSENVDAEGVFTITGLRGGSFDLSVSLDGHVTVEQPLEVPLGVVHEVTDLTLDPSLASPGERATLRQMQTSRAMSHNRHYVKLSEVARRLNSLSAPKSLGSSPTQCRQPPAFAVVPSTGSWNPSPFHRFERRGSGPFKCDTLVQS